MNDVADSTSEQIPPFIPLPELEMDYAGLCRRLLAVLVDLFVLYAFAIVAGQVLLFFWAYTQDTRTEFDLFPMLTYSMLMNLIICWLYSTLLESSRWRATLGKMAAGIQVTDRDGDRISFLRANSRFFIKYLFLLVFYPATLILIMSVHKGTESHLGIVEHLRLVAVVVFALDVLPAAFGESRQALHDRLAGTIVVERSFFRQPSCNAIIGADASPAPSTLRAISHTSGDPTALTFPRSALSLTEASVFHNHNSLWSGRRGRDDRAYKKPTYDNNRCG